MKKMILAAGLLLILAACSDSEEPSVNENSAEDGNAGNGNNAVEHGIEEEGSAGFTLTDEGEVVEADVPEEIAAEILAAYEEYIAAFNSEDIDRYMAIIADEPDGFDREEDRTALTEAFEVYDTSYETSNETIVKYSEGRAEVFAEIVIKTAETGTDRKMDQTGRQVVVFKKENDEWKVTSLHFIGNQ